MTLLVAITAVDETSYGHWHFDALPSVGDQVILMPERYEVVAVEHWPELDGQDQSAPEKSRLRIRVKKLPRE